MNSEQAEAQFVDAKKAYRKRNSPENRAAFHAARDALLQARQADRADRVGVTVTAGTAETEA